jgi:O-antigen ligase
VGRWSKLLCCLTIITITFPEGLKHIINTGNQPYFLILGIVLIILCCLTYYARGYLHPSKLLYMFVAFSCTLLFSTIINDGDFLRACKIVYIFLGAAIWSDVFFRLDYEYTSRLLARWGWLILSLNFIVDIFIPAGLSIDEWGNEFTFLSLANSMQVYWIPLFAFCLINALKKKKYFGITVFIFATMIFIPSKIHAANTGQLLIILMSIQVIFIVYVKAPLIKTSIWPIVLLIIGILSAVIVGANDLFPILNNFRTLLIRVGLWQSAILMAKQELILGYGIGSTDEIIYYNQWRNYSPHNQLIMFVLWGGLISLALFISLIIQATKKKIMLTKDKNYRILILSCVCYIIYMLLEVNINFSLFTILLFALFFYSPKSYGKTT